MPIVLVTLGKSGCQTIYVMEKDEKTNYSLFVQVLEKFRESPTCAPEISREKLATLKKLASKEKDRRLITYAVTNHLSSKKAKHLYGIGNHQKNKNQVENALTEAEEIEAAYHSIMDSEEHANQVMLSKPDQNSAVPQSPQSIRKRRQLKEKYRRKIKKKYDTLKLLKRATSNKSTLLKRHPSIDKRIETIVRDSGVGADKWRSSGSLTWERKKVGQKITFQRLRQQLQEEYSEHISHGALVQLCVPRNSRHLSKTRYKSVANIVSKRARKGFDIKLNADEKWSNSLYKSLNILQKKDNSNATYINRDDAAGFRLDTLATSSKFRSITIRGEEDLATRTDFTNKEQNILQVSSYFCTGSETSDDCYAGIVKCNKMDPKNAGQHFSDLQMLRSKPEFKSVFFSSENTDKDKEIDFIRVDGGGDENPAHNETRFMWTKWHTDREKLATIVTTRYSGGSFLNEVEHLNGQLSRSANNLFIPSTLCGNTRDISGEVDHDTVVANQNAARDVYIERVDKTRYKDGEIHLFKCALGPDASEIQEQRNGLTKYLKSSNAAKRKLTETSPDELERFQYMDKILTIMDNHTVGNNKYVFRLVCCFKQDCPHPVCQSRPGDDPSSILWYPGGPSIMFFPWPVPDPERQPEHCTTCQLSCSGHFMHLDQLLENYENGIAADPSAYLASEQLAKVFEERRRVSDNLDDAVPDEETQVLLSTRYCISKKMVSHTVNHLCQVAKNRKRGAEKAAATRAARRNDAR